MTDPALRITIVVDNHVWGKGPLAEHGFAALVEAPGGTVLFDTGQGMTLMHNARELGVDLARVDAIVLSHGHYDHTGGLPDALAAVGPEVRVYAHPAAYVPKYAGPTGSKKDRENGMPLLHDPDRLAALLPEPRRVPTPGPTGVVPGVFVTGEVPRETAFEDTGGPFFRDAALRDPDPLPDDQALFIPTPAGTVVLLGCAHAGVVNTLRAVAAATGTPRTRAVIGGMHLARATPARLAATEACLWEVDAREVAPTHCTGERASAQFRLRLGERYTEARVGTTWQFPL